MTSIAVSTVRGLRGRTRQLRSTALAVILGVAFTAGVLIFTDTLRESFDGAHADAHVGVDLAVRRVASFGDGTDAVRERVPDDVVSSVAGTSGVRTAIGRTSGWAQLVAPDGRLLGDISSGTDPIGENWVHDPALGRWQLVEGAAPSGPEVVLDRAASLALGLGVGDHVDVIAQGGTSRLRISGVATFDGADARFGSVTALFDDPTAQELVGTPGSHDRIVVSVDDGASTTLVAEAIATRLGDRFEVVTGATLVEETRALHLRDWGFFDTFMKGSAAVALLVGAFIIFNTFSITVAQRTREFALWRAIGAGRRQVLGSVLVESLAVGTVASMVGVAGGVVTAKGLHAMFATFGLELPDGGTIVRPGSLVVAFAVGVVVTAIAALVPAVRAANTPPIRALRDQQVEPRTPSHRRIAVGALVTGSGTVALVAGLAGMSSQPAALVGAGGVGVVIGVAVLGAVLARPFGRIAGAPIARLRGVPGRLARDNAVRNPRRTATTASALMIGVALVAGTTILASSVRASIDRMIGSGVRADVVVESGSFGIGGLDRSLAHELAALPEVAAVSGSALTRAHVDGDVIDVVGVRSDVFLEVMDLGRVEGSLGGGDGRGLGLTQVAIDTDTAAARGWTLGSPMEVVLVDGVTRTVTVGAIVEDPYVGFPMIVDVALLDDAGAAPFDVQVFVSLADGVDPSDGLAAVERVASAQPNATVLDRAEFADDRAALVDPLVGVIYALLGFAVLIATLGIANTLALSVTERTRELGLLRAVGADRRQVRSAIRWEAVMIAGFGTALGLAIGVGFGGAVVHALHDEGVTELAVPIARLAVVMTLAVVTGVVAAALPARRAARLDVLDALQR